MRTVGCPKKDGGVCTIPEETALVEGGEVRLASRLADEMSESEISALTLRPIDLPENWSQRLHEPAIADAIKEVAEQTGPGRTVVVNCSPCGDTWVTDLPESVDGRGREGDETAGGAEVAGA